MLNGWSKVEQVMVFEQWSKGVSKVLGRLCPKRILGDPV